jgi:hypothetical protein
MKKIFLFYAVLNWIMFLYPQSFEIKHLTTGNIDARNPLISSNSFWDPLVYFELHSGDSSNIVAMGFDSFTGNFLGITPITTGNSVRLNPYEDFNHGIVFQTNENGNFDIAYIPYSTGNWGPTIFLTNSSQDEINLSTFYISDPGFISNNFILFQRSDTVIVLEYDESLVDEYPVFVNSTQYQYSDYIGIYYNYSPNNYPRTGIHVVAIEIDSLGIRNLVYKYKPLNGQWEEKSYIKENCECRNPSLQRFYFTPGLIFEDSTSGGFRPFSVYDWEVEKDFQLIPDLLSGNVSNFKIDLPDIITSNPSPDIELEYFPHSYFIKNGDDLKIRLNKLEYGDVVGDTLITVNYSTSKMAHGALGFWNGEVFYTIWEDSSEGHIHLFGRRQLYPVGDVSEEINIDDFVLKQNYPNPFNPSTKIKFTIPQSPLHGGDGRGGLITLKVYDVLGNEIATLVNEELEAGEYEIEFSVGRDSSPDIASGIYFYQLKSGSFLETKKMLMIK